MTTTQGIARPWWTQKRWWVAIMLCTVTMIGYVDRLALSVAAPVFRKEFDFSNEQYGFITFAFLATYAAGHLLLGPVIDRLGSKRSLSLAVFWWSIASCVHAFARARGWLRRGGGFSRHHRSGEFPGRLQGCCRLVPAGRAQHGERLHCCRYWHWSDRGAAA